MNNVNNICFFGSVEACDPMKIGGNESFTRRLAIGFSERDYSITIAMYGAEKDKINNGNLAKNVTLLYHKTFLGALKSLIKVKCEIVFEMYIHKRYYPFFLAYKCINKKKKFATIFMMSTKSVLKKMLRKYFRVIFCSYIFAVSPHLVRELKNDGIDAKWLPPPVPDFYFKSFDVKKNSTIVISYLGRIDENKGVDVLVPIFKSLSNLNNITIKIRGYYVPSDRGSVNLHKTFAKMNGIDYLATKKKDCFYFPEVEKDIVDFLSDTDILVLPYISLEGTVELPLLVLEGLAAGCVVLSTGVGDIHDVIGDTECIAENVEEFKVRLERLCDPEKLRMAKERIFSKNFSSTFATSKVLNRLINYL